MKEIQILNNGDALYDIRRKINENFELVQTEAVKDPLASFGTNEGNETDGVADLLTVTDNTLSFKVGGEYPNLVMTSGDGVTTEIESVNDLHLQNLADGEYTVVVDGSNSNITDAEFYSQLLEPENPNTGDVWFNGESAKQFVEGLPSGVSAGTHSINFRDMANIGDRYLAVGVNGGLLASSDKGQTWNKLTPAVSGELNYIGCVVYEDKFYIITSDRRLLYVDSSWTVWSSTLITESTTIAPNRLRNVNNTLVATTDTGIIYSNNGLDWTTIRIDGGQIIKDICYLNGMYYAASWNSYVYSSADLKTWTKINKIFSALTCMKVYNDKILLGTTSGSFYVYDLTINEGELKQGPISGNVNDIAVIDNGVLIVGSYNLCAFTNDLKNFEQIYTTGGNLVKVHNNFILGDTGLMLRIEGINDWIAYTYIPVGEVTISGGEVTYLTTYPYNSNGLHEASSSTFGLLRTAAVTDEMDCTCNDAVITPSNLYDLSNYRMANTSYALDDKVGCPYHHNLQLKCIQAGTTSNEALDTKGYLQPETTIEDGSVIWQVEELGTGTGSGGGHSLFDTKLSDHVLTPTESKGWGLQGTYVYKEAVPGSRYGYPSFYSKCLSEYQNATNERAYLKSNVTCVGALVDNQGVLSGFNASNYATFDIGTTNASDLIEFIITFNTGTWSDTSAKACGVITGDNFPCLQIYDQKANIGGTQIYGSYSYSTNEDVTWKISIQNGSVNVYRLTTSNEFELDLSTSCSTISGEIRMGSQDLTTSNRWLNNGSVNLNESYIDINGERWWTGADYITKNPNGHLFYDISQKDQIDEVFESTGMAWMYGIDEENERIFLPRNNYFALTGGVMGNGMVLGLTDGNYNLGMYQTAVYSTNKGMRVTTGSYGKPVGTGGSGLDEQVLGFGVTTDSTKSGITLETDSDKYLYICVGNTESDNSIIDVVDITTTENDTIPLLHHIPADEILDHPSWLRSNGQWNDGNVYTTVYNYLVDEYLNGTEHTDTITTPDGEEYTVTYKTVKGKKVVDVANLIEVDTIYHVIGSAWYYVINQEDMTFRLPMSHNSECYTSDPTRVGLDVSAGLPNITGGGKSHNGSLSNGLTGALKTTSTGASIAANTGSNFTYDFIFDASLSNPIYGNSDTVTPPHTEFYLYFKVANAVQNLQLLDAGEVLERVSECITYSELETVQCVVETYVNGFSWYRVWSDGWCEQGGMLMGTASTNTTVSLLKAYANTSYQVQLTYNSTATGATSGTQSAVNLKTTTSFAIGSQGGETAWYAYGYMY